MPSSGRATQKAGLRDGDVQAFGAEDELRFCESELGVRDDVAQDDGVSLLALDAIDRIDKGPAT